MKVTELIINDKLWRTCRLPGCHVVRPAVACTRHWAVCSWVKHLLPIQAETESLLALPDDPQCFQTHHHRHLHTTRTIYIMFIIFIYSNKLQKLLVLLSAAHRTFTYKLYVNVNSFCICQNQTVLLMPEISEFLFKLTYLLLKQFYRPLRMDGWVGHVGWPIADGLTTSGHPSS